MGTAICSKWFSYAVDYLQVQGELRWALIIIFMFLKAGLIVAVFMHMVWERMAFCARYIDASTMYTRAYSLDVYRGGLYVL